MKNFNEKRVYVEDYGFRYDWLGRTFRCGTHRIKDYLRIPRNPQLKHSIAKLLWAIEFASSFLQDRPTRKQVIDICRMSSPMFAGSKFAPGKAEIQHYWTDLYRVFFINQYRRSYGKGSNKHFDVVYELSREGKEYLEMARINSSLKR